MNSHHTYCRPLSGLENGTPAGGDSREVQALLFDVHQLFATSSAFCALRADGRCVTWGAAAGGGQAPEWLQGAAGVVEVAAAGAAFAVRLRDGAVVSWGDERWGGDSRSVLEQLQAEKEKT